MCLIFLILYLSQILIEINGQCPRDAKNCTECISYSGECYWCKDEEFSTKYDPKDRCDTKQKLENNGCKKIEDYDTRDKTSSVKRNSTFSNSTQLKPQEFDIELRPGSETTIEISYKRAEDYPIDMYFLMDLSCTMRKHKDILVKISKSLSIELIKITKNFRLGFGSYVDKPIMPFSAFDLRVRNCDGLNIGSENTYSFYHRQNLTQDENAFADIVEKTQTSGNFDVPEGTLDALMQVMECNQQIGWRNDSDKIIVVSTDEEFHYAGDGKLGGILTPNDGKCHLEKTVVNKRQVWKYTHSEITDYPSMYQISEKAKNRYTIVFTVHKKVRNVFEIFKNIIGSNSMVADLSEDVTETAYLIKDIYKNISSNVKLEVKQKSNKPEDVSVEFMVKCNGKFISGSSCKFNEIKEIKFKATIRLDTCPKDRSLWKRTSFKIGLDNNEIETTINLKMLCGCDCDGTESRIQNSEYCSQNGTLSCGKCVACNGKRYGLQCQCDSDTNLNENQRNINCRKDPGSTVLCSGRGDCVCNSCKCGKSETNTVFKGKYCDLDESTCYPNGITTDQTKLCSGHGNCNDSAQCECKDGFEGRFCECNTTERAECQKVCKNSGVCKCGQCVCNPELHFGDVCQHSYDSDDTMYCNRTLQSISEVCELYYGKDQCHNRFNYTDLVFKPQIKPEEYVKLKASEFGKPLYFKYYSCQFITGDCAIKFEFERLYHKTETKSDIQLITKMADIKTCEKPLDATLLSGSIVGGIILIGLAILLIWKLLTEIWDRKEYARFQNELSKANWGQEENPLYKEAKSTFSNPMFGLKDRAQKRLSGLSVRISRRFNSNN